MTWVGWRLQRTETGIVMAILALLAALLVPTGITMADAFQQDGLGSCLAMNVGASCAARVGDFEQRFQSLITLGNWFTLVPGLIGVLLATPFILDLEHGTYRLAWTQSITRARWLRGKLGLAVLATLVASGALILLFSWWRAPQASLNGRLDVGTYDTEGIVVAGYALFALALAVALGAIWRRAVASLALAFAGYFAVRVLVDYTLRNHLVTPLTATWRGAQQPGFLYHAIVLDMSMVLGHHRQSLDHGGAFLGGNVQVVEPGLGAHTVFHALYLPASDFWPLQLTETGIFMCLAALLLAFGVWWAHERVS